jgi:hypothetical protein
MADNAEDRLAELEADWYEVIEAVQQGRTQGLACPECMFADGLQVEELQGRVIIRCPNCKREVEYQVQTA